MTIVVIAVPLILLLDASVRQVPARANPTETYASASIDADGTLVIRTVRGRAIEIRRTGEQTSFSQPVLSPDRSAVGAQALYPNCCTSYDIPKELVVYAAGKVHRFRGIGMPIFQWHFTSGGARVAFGQEPVHFGCVIHYELRDVRSERLIRAADIPNPCGQFPNPKPVSVPKWVAELNASARQQK